MCWLPWGEDAFARARAEQKPIFLSIGYSTCHWCHVMARESFMDPAIADLLNAHFVPVKVDREERPDVDRVYMAYLQAVTGHGGWPLSAWLTPELKPFYGGTYFPPEDRQGRPGFPSLLRAIARGWEEDAAPPRGQGPGGSGRRGLGGGRPEDRGRRRIHRRISALCRHLRFGPGRVRGRPEIPAGGEPRLPFPVRGAPGPGERGGR